MMELSFSRFLKELNVGVTVVICLLLVGLVGVLVVFAPSRMSGFSFQPVKRDVSATSCMIRSNAFTPPQEGPMKYVADLSREVALVGVNRRPDSDARQMMVFFPRTKQSSILSVREQIYFTYQGKGLSLSSIPTPLSATFTPSYEGVNVEVALAVGDSTEVLQSHLSQGSGKEVKNQAAKIDAPPLGALEALKNAENWGSDKLYETYGGDIYQQLGFQDRLLFKGEEEIVFVDGEIYLIWNGSRWKQRKVGDQTQGWPLACVKSNGQGKIDIDIWGRQGIYHQNFSIGMEKASGSKVQIEQMLTRVRMRTASRISCKLGKKNTVIKKGDWLLHNDGNWKVVRGLDEIDKCLSMKVRGDLFVFDGVEKEKEESMITGHLFDVKRTSVERIVIPVNRSDKVQEFSGRSARRRYSMDDYDDDDDDYDDEDDDFNDDNDDYLQMMHSRGRHESYDRY